MTFCTNGQDIFWYKFGFKYLCICIQITPDKIMQLFYKLYLWHHWDISVDYFTVTSLPLQCGAKGVLKWIWVPIKEHNIKFWKVSIRNKILTLQLRFQKHKTPTADFLINISSLDILKILLHQCRSRSKLHRRNTDS